VRGLAEWGAITTQAQAEELLDLMLCPHFDPVDLQARPLSKLRASPTPTASPGNQSFVALPATGQSGEPPLNDRFSRVSPTEPLRDLPQPLSSFIGRHKEVAELTKLLIKDRVRLLTLVGAGGSGKTRLSLKVAAELANQFSGGVWLVELAPLNNPALIPQAISETLGIAEQPDQTILDTLIQYFRPRQALLVLDNCEHLVEECSRVVEKLLKHSTHLQILATSREGLGISGEISYRVPSLSLPQPEETISAEKVGNYEALQLFVERARTASPDFRLEPGEIPALVQVCRRLDGIPLALELAAARTRVLTLGQVQSRLDDRFHLLTGGSRTALPRQQTLRALADWSYNLLSEPEKRLLSRASVFAGSWNLPAGERVCSGPGLDEYAVLDGLTSLANKSLLVVDKSGEEVRYSLLETIRQYGLEKLQENGEEAEVRARHLAYFIAMGEGLVPKTKFSGQSEMFKRLDGEMDNLRAAIDYGLRLEQFEGVSQLIRCLFMSWESRGNYREGRDYMEQALSLPTARGVARGELLGIVGFFTFRQGDVQAARRYIEESQALSREFDNKYLLMDALVGLGSLALEEGNHSEAGRYFSDVLTVAKEIQLIGWQGGAMNNLGLALLEESEYAEAHRLMLAAEAIDRESGNLWSLTGPLLALAAHALVLEDYPAAHRYLAETLSISAGLGLQLFKSITLAFQGMAWYNDGKFGEARQSLDASLAFGFLPARRREATYGLVGAAGLLSKIWLEIKQPTLLEQVACLSGAIAALQAAKDQVLLRPIRDYFEQAREIARYNLTGPTFEEAFARGQAMSLDEATTYARQALAGLHLR
jgi:non-specific serine/threonine protein kinase